MFQNDKPCVFSNVFSFISKNEIQIILNFQRNESFYDTFDASETAEHNLLYFPICFCIIETLETQIYWFF